MEISKVLMKTKYFCDTVLSSCAILTSHSTLCRGYKKGVNDDGCRRACVDIPPDPNPVCPEPCNRWGKRKDSILHKIKLKIIEGGTNFGTPFRRLQCKEKVRKEMEIPEPKALPPPSKKVPPLPPPRPGVQVSVLGADTNLGQYIALLLKQCPCIKKLRLYQTRDTQCSECNRDLCKVVQDIQHIDTNCIVQAYSCVCNELDKCLQTLKETGWYNPKKLLGSLAVPEMRASTLAARALCLEPSYVHVPCVGGTEGPSLVPLFSRALDYFDFSEQNSGMMTQAVRSAPLAVSRYDGNCARAAELSEAHALTRLVTKVAWALLCKDVPRVTGFVETDGGQVISPSRFIANSVEITGTGIVRSMGLPKMSDVEINRVDIAVNELYSKHKMVYDWYCKYFSSSGNLDAYQLQFFKPKPFLGMNVYLNNKGICDKVNIPRLTQFELELMDFALLNLKWNEDLAMNWYQEYMSTQPELGRIALNSDFLNQRNYNKCNECKWLSAYT
ncbi:unnamed protein product, partial [Brenthis ino]